MAAFGSILLLVGLLSILALIAGVIILLIGAVASKSKLVKAGAYCALSGALGLLASFSLCSTMNFK